MVRDEIRAKTWRQERASHADEETFWRKQLKERPQRGSTRL